MRKYSCKFWITFWTISALFLFGWFLFCNIKSKGIGLTVSDIINVLPVYTQQKNEYRALAIICDYFFQKDGQEKTLLILFQNNLEIRPGGGFIGAFGVAKIKNGKMISLETHDLSNFDARIPNTIDPPYPMKEISYVDFWKMRDSNFSPDFEVNAKKAVEFYHLGNGTEKIDGVIGITSNVLTSILKITGPLSLDGYPGIYESENAVLLLEYQVEKAFEAQGIDRIERKSIMSDLAKEIERRVLHFSIKQKIQLAQSLLADLASKDIQLNFSNPNLQQSAKDANWAGLIDNDWNKDYLMTSDANLGAFKSDYYVKKSMEYTVDLSKESPVANLKITYTHNATQKDWMTRNYLTYLRIYVPEGSKFVDSKNFDELRLENNTEVIGKKYFAAIVRVPIATSKTVEINYTLPKSIKENYSFKIQKQAGINDENVDVHIKYGDDKNSDYKLILKNDTVVK